METQGQNTGDSTERDGGDGQAGDGEVAGSGAEII